MSQMTEKQCDFCQAVDKLIETISSGNELSKQFEHPRFVRACKAVVCSISEVSAQLWVCLLCFLLCLTHNCCDIGIVQNTLC